MGVMAVDANSVFTGIRDGLAGMRSFAQRLNHFLMAARALIRIEKLFQRPIDQRGIGMELFARDFCMAIQA
jgi:hypothetical protein